MVIAVAEHPGFADRTTNGQRRAEHVGQTTAAPEPVLIDWFESQGVQKLLTQELSLLLLRTIGRPCRPEQCLSVIASSWNRQGRRRNHRQPL
jgi:predicted phosphoribosyltransferase